MITALNYLWVGGHETRRRQKVGKQTLTKAQRMTVDHLKVSPVDFYEVDKLCPDIDSGHRMLVEAKFDYCGEPVMVMEELEAAKVIPVWPKIGEAAVQKVEDFLTGDLLEAVLNPEQCLLPSWEWPSRAVKSKVRASQSEWEAIVAAGFARGLMTPVLPDEVFRDSSGDMVLNGAGGVKKMKTIGGETRTMQRFISNFIPSNAFQRHLSGGDKHLPYLGQLTLLEQGEEDCWVIDSEEFTSCFNLFKLPAQWNRYMCFAKPVDAAIMGGAPGQLVYPAMCVVPMGWLNAVSVIQEVVRNLVFQGAQVPEDSEVSKLRNIPESDDLSVIYLDSFDHLRRLDRSCAEIMEGSPSARHQRFIDLCQSKGLALNEKKESGSSPPWNFAGR